MVAQASRLCKTKKNPLSFPNDQTRTTCRMRFVTIRRRRLPHIYTPGATYFVTWRIASGTSELSETEKTITSNALQFFKDQRYLLYAFVVMDDHVHVVLTTMAQYPLEKTLHSWKSFSSKAIGKHRGKMGIVWQDESFDRQVRDEQDMLEKMQYILGNPKKRWPEAADYPWVWAEGFHS